MLTTNNTYHKPHYHQDAIMLLDGMRAIYQSSKNLLNSTLFILFLIVISPIIVLALLFIKFLLWKVHKEMKVKIIDFKINTGNYKYHRNNYDYFMKKIDSTKGLELTGNNWIIDVFFPEIKKIDKAVVNYECSLKTQLDAFDNGLNDGELFNGVSEKDLWNRRTKAYSYKM